jgi:hypothetical protein
MEFKGLLALAREARKADSAQIITRVPWSDQAKGFARESGIDILTYAEKVSQLINFKVYLQNLIDRFEAPNSGRPSEPPMLKYYIDLSAERSENGKTENLSIVNEYIYQWLQKNNTYRQIVILGGYGAGKSSLCLKIAYDLARSYLNEPQSIRIPILINLREFTKTFKIEALIINFLDDECNVVNPKFQLFKAMNDAGMFLVIFDGFDEMAVKTDSDVLESNLQEIEKLAASPNAKVILTSRPEYFIGVEEESKAFRPALSIIRTREVEYEALKILPWDKKQVENFIEKRVPLIKGAKRHWTYYKDQIGSIPNLSDLSQRPVLLEMIVKTLPVLIESCVDINLPNLYEIYLSEEIKRQRVLQKRTLLITDSLRFSLLETFATESYCDSASAITFADAHGRIGQELKPARNEHEAYTRDFLTCSFLLRKGDEYQFSHKSILEYLVAKHLKSEIDAGNPDVFGRCLINPVITDFLVQLRPDASRLWHWINASQQKATHYSSYAISNAATLLCALDKGAFAGKDLSGLVILGANLSGANLRGVNFKGTVLNNVSLKGARFKKADIMPANISNSTFSFHFKSDYILNRDTAFSDYNATFSKLWGKESYYLSEDLAVDSELEAMSMSYFKDGSTAAIDIKVKDLNRCETLRQELSIKLSKPVALYADEYDEIVSSFLNTRESK